MWVARWTVGVRLGARDPDRILDPEQVEVREGRDDPARGGHVPKRVQLDHHIHLAADGLTDPAERLECLVELGGRDVMTEGRLGVGVERPDLHAGRALVEQAAGQLGGAVEEGVQILVASVGVRLVQAPVRDRLRPASTDVAFAGAGVVGADLVARPAPEQVVQRLAERLAEQVP